MLPWTKYPSKMVTNATGQEMSMYCWNLHEDIFPEDIQGVSKQQWRMFMTFWNYDYNKHLLCITQLEELSNRHIQFSWWKDKL